MIDYSQFEPYIIDSEGYARNNSFVAEDSVPNRSASVKYKVYIETNKVAVGVKPINDPPVRIWKYFDISHDIDKIEENIQYYIDKWYEDEVR